VPETITYAAFYKESRKRCANATNLDRKSGGVEGSAVTLSQPQSNGKATHLPFVIPSAPRISYCAVPETITYAAFYNESRKRCANATNLDRKSGGVEGSAVTLSLPQSNGKATHLPFVIPSAVEGSAVTAK
jgi:hypothetical protein